MALLLRGKTECTICGKVIGQDDDIVATSHFIGDHDDPLWRFSDSVMHAGCFSDWRLREEFVGRYNATIGQITWGNGTRHSMKEDGSIVSIRAEADTNKGT